MYVALISQRHHGEKGEKIKKIRKNRGNAYPNEDGVPTNFT